MNVPFCAVTTDNELIKALEKRLGRLHARQRLGIETDHEAQVFGQGLNFFHIENLRSSHFLIRMLLVMTGLYRRGLSNAKDVQLRHNHIRSSELPSAFDGFTILQLSDLHADMNEGAMDRIATLLREISYDICILTGDYRGPAFGPFEATLVEMARIRSAIRGAAYGVLGNHATIRLLPGLDNLGTRLLVNVAETLERGEDRIHLVGVDDAHFYRMDNIEKATAGVPPDEFSILISHTPEIYRQAAYADFDVLISGHTHGGQICLPGGIPLTLDSVLREAWVLELGNIMR